MKYDENDPATWNAEDRDKTGDTKDAKDRTAQPNKPGGAVEPDGDVRAPRKRQAVENQGKEGKGKAGVTPDDYPKDDGGRPDYKK